MDHAQIFTDDFSHFGHYFVKVLRQFDFIFNWTEIDLKRPPSFLQKAEKTFPTENCFCLLTTKLNDESINFDVEIKFDKFLCQALSPSDKQNKETNLFTHKLSTLVNKLFSMRRQHIDVKMSV